MILWQNLQSLANSGKAHGDANVILTNISGRKGPDCTTLGKARMLLKVSTRNLELCAHGHVMGILVSLFSNATPSARNNVHRFLRATGDRVTDVEDGFMRDIL